MQLYHGDCLEVMKQLPDNSIDMVLCDLPYGMTACKWDCVIPFEDLWAAYKRICKKNAAIVLFGSEPFSSYLRMSNIKNFKYDWIWHKNSSGGFATAKTRPMKYHEIISVFYDKQPVYNPQFQPYSKLVQKTFTEGERSKYNKSKCVTNGMEAKSEYTYDFKRGKYPESVQYFKAELCQNRLHPTQKPVALCEYLIKTYTKEGMTVLDNCMGSGTTGVACLNLKRDFIGIELDEHYFEVASQRIENVKAHQSSVSEVT